MNEIRLNAFKALAVAIVLTLPLMLAIDQTIGSIRQKYLIENNCSDENVVCDFLPVEFLLMPFPLIVYFLTFNYFEKKRKKTWRSYN